MQLADMGKLTPGFIGVGILNLRKDNHLKLEISHTYIYWTQTSFSCTCPESPAANYFSPAAHPRTKFGKENGDPFMHDTFPFCFFSSFLVSRIFVPAVVSVR